MNSNLQPVACVAILTAVGLVSGCRTLDSYVQADPAGAQRTYLADSASLLSENRLSRYTRELLAQIALPWDPQHCDLALEKLSEAPVAASWRLFATAELSLAAARSGKCPLSSKYLHLNGARAAYAFLKDGGGTDHRPPEHIATSLYNRCVAELLLDGRPTTPLADPIAPSFLEELGVTVDRSSTIAMDGLDRLIDADRFRITGLIERHRRAGAGAALIGVRSHAKTAPFLRNTFEPGQAIALTAVLHFDSGDGRATLHIINSAEVSEVQFSARRLPLAADFSAPYAWTQGGTTLRRLGLIGTVLPDRMSEHRGILMPEPFAPGKIPVLMIHGFASSPQAWRNLTNEIYGRPDLHRRFQVWHYFYPSGLPYLYSAQELRRDLSELRAKICALYGADALRPLVVIGHSQGGLLARALVTHPERRLWDAVFAVSPSDVALSSPLRATVQDALMFEPVPDIARVVFMATPHHGSAAKKTSWFAALVNFLIDVPDDFANDLRQIYRAHPEQLREPARPWFARGGPTAVDSMADNAILLGVLGQLPLAPGTHYHSLIGAKTKDGDGIATDGLVNFRSAHLDGVDSEFLFKADHRDIDGAEVTAEIVRILNIHISHEPR